MSSKSSEQRASSDQGSRPSRLLDLLVEPVPATSGVRRDDNEFVVDEPWAIARFGKINLRRGWWTFECKGEGDVGGVELRLLSPEDTLLAFSLRRRTHGRTFFHADKTFDISLLVSAWPGRVRFKMLRLRRLSAAEQASLIGGMLLRLMRSDRPFSMLVQTASRVLAGRTLQIRSPAVPESTEQQRSDMPGLASGRGTIRAAVSGSVTVMLGEHERLHPRALEIVANVFARTPRLRAAYSDVCEGDQIRPRPEWDADLASAANYVDSPVFFRGQVDAGSAQNYLNSMAKEDGAIARIALPLVCRATPQGRSITAPAIPSLASTPLVSVVIPTKIRVDLLERCLQGLAEQTGYPALEVVIVNGSPDHPRFREVIAQASTKLALRSIDYSGSFNFSRIVNLGVRQCKGEIILLLNDDVEAIEPGWLHRMVASVTTEGVGCVGARLLYPDRTIQHAGVMLGISGVCGHLWKGLSPEEAALIPQVVLPSQRMAVTGACLAVRRELFDRVGGLDEISFPVAFNDIDFCLRIRAQGCRTIYRGDAALIHHESQSRGPDDATMESRKRLARETTDFLDRWGPLLLDDPFGSPAFDQMLETGAVHPSLHARQL